MSKEFSFQTITGEGIVVGTENMTLEQAKDRCRDNVRDLCMQDCAACDLKESGTCHRGSPAIIARDLDKLTLRLLLESANQL